MNPKEIKTKRPWRRIRPDGYMEHGTFNSTFTPDAPADNASYTIVTQADFLREYYPTGHRINDPASYPDIWKTDVVEELDAEGNPTGKKVTRYYQELVPRFSFAFQQIIAVKQCVHLCGNDIQFELLKTDPAQREEDTFTKFREGWLKKDMEIAFFEGVKSVKITGDGAVVGYMNKGEFGWKALSFMNGDTLYPHFDSITGELTLFARAYCDYDDDGTATTEYLEVWDSTHLRRFKRDAGVSPVRSFIWDIFGLSGYQEVGTPVPHGFPRIPVAYMRDENGACWSPSQDSCDGYELSFSQMMHNNQAYGEPILVFKGEGDSVDINRMPNGTIKTINMSADDEASYLSAQSASESYMRQLEMLYKMIYEQSFAVIPPELKSGDLPAAALKILYSPAYEKAMVDASDYQPFLNELVDMFTHGYGVEVQDTIGFSNLPLKWWIKPYVHVSESSMVADLATAVINGFCSHETASEKLSTIYTTNNEWERILREKKEEQEADLLYQMQTERASVEIEQQYAPEQTDQASGDNTDNTKDKKE